MKLTWDLNKNGSDEEVKELESERRKEEKGGGGGGGDSLQ